MNNSPNATPQRPAILVPTQHIAFVWGIEDTQHKQPCAPELYFGSRTHRVAYCLGYQKISPNDTTKHYLGGR